MVELANELNVNYTPAASFAFSNNGNEDLPEFQQATHQLEENLRNKRSFGQLQAHEQQEDEEEMTEIDEPEIQNARSTRYSLRRRN